MNAAELKAALAQVPDDTEILVWESYSDSTRGTYNVTADTDMRTGELKLVICADDKDPGPAPLPGNLRDYEHHPAFESTINKWIFE